ncbi:isoamylase [soil metagenome]
MSPRRVWVHAPHATRVELGTDRGVVQARRETDEWVAEFDADDGDTYWLMVDGGPRLLDPHCWALVRTEDGPRSVVRKPWARHPQGAQLSSPPVVYELHVRGFGRTFRGCIEHLDHVASLGANVIELMPVHPFDNTDNYWGYMPLVWGAVHGPYATDALRAAEELAELVAAAHDRGMHVWLDVVFNHTGEGDASLPTLSLRGLDDENAYRHHPDGAYYNDSGCGNDTNPADDNIRSLVTEALNRYADLGIDGFRFDLASLLGRDDGGMIEQITQWGAQRGVRLIAEPWDLDSYQVGSPMWPADWLQWNDRFRDDVRGFLRGEPGLVPIVRDRVQGSPDLFVDGAASSLNFVTAHDGLTMFDLTTETSDRHHAWDSGEAQRLPQMKNYFAMLLLSAGTPMWVMGDEFARTQQGNDNPYDIDGPLSWMDWQRAAEWTELTDFVRTLTELRRQRPPTEFRFYGADGDVDESHDSHSIAWYCDELYVMVNAWWEPLAFTIQESGEWTLALTTAPQHESPAPGVEVAARSIVVLQRR